MRTGKQYDEEFKKQAVKPAEEIGNKAAADELGIPKGTFKRRFLVIDNLLYYISGKIKIKIKEHFDKTKVIALDLMESAIKYEKRTEMAGQYF